MYLLSQLKEGFGNKLYMIMNYINIFLKHKEYKGLALVQVTSRHDKGTEEENFTEIFPKLKEIPWLNFVTWREYDKLKENGKEIPIDYHFTSDDFVELRPFIKKYFVINPKYDYLLSKYDTKKGIGVHIRLGDKLQINKRELKSKGKEKYLIISPRYYVEQVQKLLKEKKGPVYIFTDSPEFAKCFEFGEVVDEGFIETFFLFTKFKRSVIGDSTLTIAASYMNFLKHESIVPDYRINPDTYKLMKSNFVHPEYFTLVSDRSYKLKPSEYSSLNC